MSDSEGRSFKPIHRIAGAIVLVVLAVVFLPMIFRPRAETTATPLPQSVPSAAPLSTPAQTPTPVTAPASASGAAVVPVAPADTQAATAPGPAVSAPAAAAAGSATSAPEPGVQAKPEPSSVRRAVTHPVRRRVRVARSASPRGWFVQIAAFSNERAARALAHRFAIHGFHARVDWQRARRRTYYRVRIGPYRNRVQALHAQYLSRKVWPRGRTLLVDLRR
ncbi:MAG: SPOR domain-containing protein [Acidiferrobacteraceae bacterium]